MLHTSIIPGLLTLFFAHASLATPLPFECSCANSPLSPRTVDYIIQVTKSRVLTEEECAFICNPSPSPVSSQQPFSTSESVAFEVSSDSPSATSGPPTPSTLPASTTEVWVDLGPPLFDPATPRPLPLFDGPPSQPSSPSVISNGIMADASYARTQSTLSPSNHSALLPCAARIFGSLLLLLVIAVCLVELGDVVISCFNRRSRRRGFSGSGRVRLDVEEEVEKGGRWGSRGRSEQSVEKV